MLFGMALRDVRRGGYGIFLFITITFCELAFYLYNFAMSQNLIAGLAPVNFPIFGSLKYFNYVILFFAVIFVTAIVLYIIHNMTKCKKDDLHSYHENGLSVREITNMLLIEVLFIGVLAIITGLALGVIASTLLANVSSLFAPQSASDAYAALYTALIGSFVVFVLILVVAMVFQSVNARRRLYAERPKGDDETPNATRIMHPALAAALFVFSIVMIVAAYHWIINTGLFSIDMNVIGAALLGFFGTMLFFLALSALVGHLPRMKENDPSLGIFVIRSVSRKFHKRFVTTALACVFLAAAMVGLATGLPLQETLVNAAVHTTPYDASFVYKKRNEQNVSPIDVSFEGANDFLNRCAASYHEIRYRACHEITYSILLNGRNMDWSKAIILSRLYDPIPIISLTDYNNALKMQGKPTISLGADQYAFNCNDSEQTRVVYNYYMGGGGTITLNIGVILSPKNSEAFNYALETNFAPSDFGTLVIPDALFYADASLVESSVCLNINYNPDYVVSGSEVKATLKNEVKGRQPRLISKFYQRDRVYHKSRGSIIISSCAIVFMCFILLIACAVTLAVSNTTSIGKNAMYYWKQDKYGRERTASGAIFSQISLGFLFPVFLSVAHALVLIRTANIIVRAAGNIDLFPNHFVIAAITVFMLLVYFVTAFLGARGISENWGIPPLTRR